jgi:superfamily II DNA or RNA helicase
LTEDFKEMFGSMTNITIENIDSKSLAKETDYDMLIIDEAHHVAAKTYQNLNKKAWTKIYYRYFLTATPFRNRNEESLLFEGIAGEVIHRLSYNEAVTQGLIVPVEAFYLELPKKPSDAHTWAQVYSSLIVNNTQRNEAIATLMQSLAQNTLCLVKEVNHGQILADFTGVPFANGADDESRRYIKLFAEGKIPKLIATEGLASEGVDTKACEVVIIAGLGKAKSSFMQKVGRSVRKYPGKETGKVILIKDRSHRFTIRHFNEQIKILREEYGIEPIKID